MTVAVLHKNCRVHTGMGGNSRHAACGVVVELPTATSARKLQRGSTIGHLTTKPHSEQTSAAGTYMAHATYPPRRDV